MNCQHDALLPNCTMEIQLNWQGSRIVCVECLRAAFVTKRGRITDADPPEHTMPTPTIEPRYCDCTSFCMRQSKNIDARLCKAARAGLGGGP